MYCLGACLLASTRQLPENNDFHFTVFQTSPPEQWTKNCLPSPSGWMALRVELRKKKAKCRWSNELKIKFMLAIWSPFLPWKAGSLRSDYQFWLLPKNLFRPDGCLHRVHQDKSRFRHSSKGCRKNPVLQRWKNPDWVVFRKMVHGWNLPELFFGNVKAGGLFCSPKYQKLLGEAWGGPASGISELDTMLRMLNSYAQWQYSLTTKDKIWTRAKFTFVCWTRVYF